MRGLWQSHAVWVIVGTATAFAAAGGVIAAVLCDLWPLELGVTLASAAATLAAVYYAARRLVRLTRYDRRSASATLRN